MKLPQIPLSDLAANALIKKMELTALCSPSLFLIAQALEMATSHVKSRLNIPNIFEWP